MRGRWALPGAAAFLAVAVLTAGLPRAAAAAERSTRQLLQAGGLAIEESDFEAAANRFREAVEIDPKLPQGHFGMAIAALGRRDRRGAEKSLRTALALAPSMPEVRYALGVTAFAAGDVRAAEIDLKAAADADATFLEARYALGLAAAQRGDLKAAEAALRQALRLSAQHAASHYQLGAVLARGGDLDGGLDEMARALAREPGLREAADNDALVFATRVVRPAAASATLGLPLPVLRPALAWARRRASPATTASLPAEIPDWYLHYQMALQLEDAGAWQGSIDRLQKALAIKDRSEALAVVADRLADYSPHLHLAHAYHQVGNFRDAFLHLGLAKNEGNASPEALRALGVLVQKDRLRPRIYLDPLPDRTTDAVLTVRGLILADEPVQRVEVSGREAVLRPATAQEISQRLPDGEKAAARDSGQGVVFEVAGQRLAEGSNIILICPEFRNPARDGDRLEARVVRVPPPPPPQEPAAVQPAKPATPKGGSRKPKPPAAGTTPGKPPASPPATPHGASNGGGS